MRILVAEDEEKMASFIRRGLEEEGCSVDVVHDGQSGYDTATSAEYDLIILDWMMPKMEGIEVCKKLRDSQVQTPILMLTVKDDVDDKIKGLNQGADDYLTKPFAFDELLARVRALIRRQSAAKSTTLLESNELKVDLLKRKVTLNEEEVDLSQKEFSLLEYLMQHKDDVVTRSKIAEEVWGMNFDPMSNTIDVYINFLRKKIDSGRDKSRIQTVRGAGYRFSDA